MVIRKTNTPNIIVFIEPLGRGTGGGRDPSLNVILGAAQGPGDYHGTMSKAELEREAGGRIFTSQGSETRGQVETTRSQGSGGYQGGSRSSGKLA